MVFQNFTSWKSACKGTGPRRFIVKPHIPRKFCFYLRRCRALTGVCSTARILYKSLVIVDIEANKCSGWWCKKTAFGSPLSSRSSLPLPQPMSSSDVLSLLSPISKPTAYSAFTSRGAPLFPPSFSCCMVYLHACGLCVSVESLCLHWCCYLCAAVKTCAVGKTCAIILAVWIFCRNDRCCVVYKPALLFCNAPTRWREKCRLRQIHVNLSVSFSLLSNNGPPDHHLIKQKEKYKRKKLETAMAVRN